MRKTMLILILLIAFCVPSVNAKIMTYHDKFTDGEVIFSNTKPDGIIDMMNFSKEISGEFPTYDLLIKRTRLKDSGLADLPVSIKTSEHSAYELKDYRYKFTKSPIDSVSYDSIIIAKISADTAREIKDTNRFAIRFETIDGMPWTYVLPDSVLAEWKQVINATEWDILQAIENKKKK